MATTVAAPESCALYLGSEVWGTGATEGTKMEVSRGRVGWRGLGHEASGLFVSFYVDSCVLFIYPRVDTKKRKLVLTTLPHCGSWDHVRLRTRRG